MNFEIGFNDFKRNAPLQVNFSDADEFIQEIISDLQEITSDIVKREGLTNQGQKIEYVEMPFTEFIKTTLFRNLWILKIQKMLNTKGSASIPFIHDSDPFVHFLPQGHSEALEIKLSNIGVIDHSKVDWGQVKALREDADSSTKLRRFRLFMTENYKGRDGNYIRDDLLLKIYDYEQVCKKHGLELIISSVSKILDTKSIVGTLAASAASTLVGDLTCGILSGVAIQIGQVAINIAEKRLEFESKKNNSEIAYLMEIKGRIEKGKFQESGIRGHHT